MTGIDPIQAARIAWRKLATPTDGAFDVLSVDDKVALMELGLDDPAIREAATVTVEIA
ncbi:hypothetical protein [Williamsia deligens]|uniref:Uncharacterized protein n=1 Tax=Williamsia deligens TaxID=321325 RepID=A0ABW3G6K3_9NOCA|nr:hypothetical protein [Williamsia deligens]MCP2193405.1 hypothetical protein [Williamsia deligens]